MKINSLNIHKLPKVTSLLAFIYLLLLLSLSRLNHFWCRELRYDSVFYSHFSVCWIFSYRLTSEQKKLSYEALDGDRELFKHLNVGPIFRLRFFLNVMDLSRYFLKEFKFCALPSNKTRVLLFQIHQNLGILAVTYKILNYLGGILQDN